MKYLKLFQTQEEYNAYSIVDFPNISYVKGAKSVFYNTEVPFYIEAIEDLTVTVNAYSSDSVSYSIDGIEWIALTTDNKTTPIIPAGNKVYFKNESPSDNQNRSSAMFNISAPCKLGGNIMSMLYGDDYSGKTEVPKHCFRYMFNGQTAIIDASALLMPATILAEGCYRDMFSGCTSLVNAPILPAKTLVRRCYQSMFYNCNNLNYIKMLATDISAYDCLYGWVDAVASSGTFVKNKNATWNVTGGSGIPKGWTVETAEA